MLDNNSSQRPSRRCDWFLVGMLTCISLIPIGSVWVFDTPGSISAQLRAWFGGEDKYTRSMNLAFYSVYSWPNVGLALVGGYVIDRVTGIRLGALIFCGFAVLGQFIFALGIQERLYGLALAGRFIYGLGGESLTVAQTAFTVKWFDGPRLALSMGVVTCLQRLGSAIDFAVTPDIAAQGVPFAIWLGAAACTMSLGFAAGAWYLDRTGEARHPEKKARPVQEDPITIAQIKAFPRAAWLIMIASMLYYISVSQFFSIASDILQNTGNKYGEETASRFLSIPTVVGIFTSIMWGQLVDKKGEMVRFVLLSSFGVISSHVWFLALAYQWVDHSPAYIMIWFGISYSLGGACLTPMLSLVVEKRLTGTAFGIMSAIQNTGQAIFPLIVGAVQDAKGIKDDDRRYTLPVFLLIGVMGLSTLVSFSLLHLDRFDRTLSATGAEREERANSASAEQATLTQVETNEALLANDVPSDGGHYHGGQI